MASKATYGSGVALLALLITQALSGDVLAAALAAIALGAGAVGYTQDRTLVGGLLRRLR